MFFSNTKKNKKKKNQEDKQFQDQVNFTRIISLFLLGFFVYVIITITFLLSIGKVNTFQDFVIIAFPLPLFICVLIYFLDKDERIKMNNLEVQREIEKIKDMYDTRKGAERQFDNS